MSRVKSFLLVPLLGLASLQAFACYTVYDGNNAVVYQSEKAPVDMSRPLHETLPARFPGASMVFDQSAACTVLSSVAQGNGGPITRTSSPLLTDERTARELRLPHRSLGRNIALVPSATVIMEPGVTVVPSAVASKSQRGDNIVITEYRNPPVTVTRRGDEVIVSEVR